ncbi:MAG: ATP-dependent helicase [Lawsonella clevelandensis]
MAQVMARYEELKRRSDGMLLDFNDLLLYMSAALDEFPGIAEEFRASYRSFVVDEYQDVTPLQQRLLDGWLGERDDLTVVGDPNQTIYSFNGASPEFLVSFRRRFPHATFVTLVRDYRSTPEIVSCANKVIADAKGDVSQPSMQLRGQQQRGSAPQILRFDDDFQEAEEVATAIAADIVAGQLPENIAILYRTNAQSALFEQALEERHIPYQVRGGEGFFQRTEISRPTAS